MAEYVYDQAWELERQRLAGLEAALDPGTFRHLESLGIGPSWRCLEVGGGGGSVVRWLCAHAGEVVATDLDTRFLDGIDAPNLTVRTHDVVTEDLERDAFDLVHSRDVLEHIPEREAVLDKLAGAVKPGGWLMVEDVDFMGALTRNEPFGEPNDVTPLLMKMWAAMLASFEERGIDAEYGRRLPWRLRERGLVDVGAEARSSLIHGGAPGAKVLELSASHFRPQLVASGALTEDEADRVIAAARSEEYMSFAPMHVAAWGRKPG